MLRIELPGEELYCSDLSGDAGSSVRRLAPETLSRLEEWARRYDAAVAWRPPVALATIGRDIAVLLNEGDGGLERGLRGVGEIGLEIVVAGTPDARGRALLEVPWEILAPDGIFLSADPEASILGRAAAGCGGLASEEMVEFSASGAPERPATSLAQARGGDEVAIGTVG